MFKLHRALAPALIATLLLAWSASDVFAQSRITMDPDNPGRRIVEIGDEPAPRTQPELAPSTEAGYSHRAVGSCLVADFPEQFAGSEFRYWSDGVQPLTAAPRSLYQRDADGQIISSQAAANPQSASSNGTVRYTGTWPNVDDVFTPLPGRVKHDTMVLTKPSLHADAAWFGTSWHVRIPAGLAFTPAVTSEQVTIGPLQVANPEGCLLYSISMVEAVDANGNRFAGRLRIAPDGDGYLVSVEVPASDMRAAVYPVAIDPTVDIILSGSNNMFPWGSGTPEGRVAKRYDASQIGGGGTITEFAVRAANAYPALNYPRVVIRIGETTKTSGTFSQTWDQNFDANGPFTVYDGAMNFNAAGALVWFNNITFQTPYVYSGSNALTIEWTLYGTNTQNLDVFVEFTSANALNARCWTHDATVTATSSGKAGNANSIRLVLLDTPKISSPGAGAMTDGYVGTGYNVDVDATGGQAPLAFDISAGSLPPGLNINSTTGIISGNPTTPGNYAFTVRVTDNAAKTDTRDYTIQVYSALQITSPGAGALADGVQNVPYGPLNINASGGKAALVWSIPAGTLPTGLSINSGTGAISGTPTGTGLSNFTVRVTDANGVFVERAYSITVYDLPTITSPATGALTPEGYVGDAYSRTWTAAGGVPAYTWSVVSGSLPAGLSLNTGTGQISGNPTTAGNSSFSIRVTDTNNDTDTEAYTLQILALPTISSPAAGPLPQATRNAPNYTQTFTGSNGKAPLAWSATGLPAGMSLNSGTGVLSGTPTAAGSFNINVTVTDANGKTDVKAYTLLVAAAVALTGSSLPDAEEDLAYSQTPGNSGGTAPYTWSMLISPSLPDLSMDVSTGLITGTPSAGTSNNYNVTVTLTDSLGGTANKNYTFYVTQPGGGTAANCGCNSRATAQDSAFMGWLFLLLPLLLIVARRRTA